MMNRSFRRLKFYSQSATLRLEELESRFAPATLVDPMTVTYQDVDGDAVTLKISQPILSSATINQVLTFDTGSVNGDNSLSQQLQKVDLTVLGSAARGTALTITAVKNGGDGFVNVGFIHAAGIDLGSITVGGDLGKFDAGDGSTTIQALNSLSVQSMGKLGITTQATGGDLRSAVNGIVGTLGVSSDLAHVSISASQIQSLNIGGSMIGGQIVTTGNIGPVQITGDLQGEAVKNSGLISSSGLITSVTMGGSIRGGDGLTSAAIQATNGIGPVQIGGGIFGGKGSGSGRIATHGTIGNVSLGAGLIGGTGGGAIIQGDGGIGTVHIHGDIQGGPGASYSGMIKAGSGKIGDLTVDGSIIGTGSNTGWVLGKFGMGAISIQGDIVGGSGTSAGALGGVGPIGNVFVGGSIRGGSGTSSGTIVSNFDSNNEGPTGIGSVYIGGGIYGGTGSSTGMVYTDSAINGDVTLAGGGLIGGTGGGAVIWATAGMGNVHIHGDVQGGPNASYSGLIKARYGHIGNLTIDGSLIGTGLSTGWIRAYYGFGAIAIAGDIVGGSGVQSGFILSDVGNIPSITVSGSIRGGGGADSGEIRDSQNLVSGGSIGPVYIGGGIYGGSGSGSGQIYTVSTIGDVTLAGGGLIGGTGSGAVIWANAGIGNVHIHGDVQGGPNASYSGMIKCRYGAIGDITIDGSLIGTGYRSAWILCWNSIGKVTISGNIVGGSGQNSGEILGNASGATIASIYIGGSIQGGSGLSSGDIEDHSGTIGPIQIGGGILGGSGDNSGGIYSSGPLGDITISTSGVVTGTGGNSGVIQGDGIGQVQITGDLTGTITSVSGSITGVSITGSLIGSTSNTGLIFGGGILGPVHIGKDLQGGSVSGANSVDSSGYIQGQHITSVFIGGSIISGVNTGSGTLTKSGSIRAQNDIVSITVRGSITGNSSNPVVISGQDQLTPATNDWALRSLLVVKDVTYANILAGYDVNGNPADGSAQIGSVTVRGNWTASNLVAGISAGPDGLFGTADDVQIPRLSKKFDSKIVSLQIDGQVTGTPSAVNGTDHFGIVAEYVAKFTLGGVTIPLHPGPDNDSISLGTTGDVILLEV